MENLRKVILGTLRRELLKQLEEDFVSFARQSVGRGREVKHQLRNIVITIRDQYLPQLETLYSLKGDDRVKVIEETMAKVEEMSDIVERNISVGRLYRIAGSVKGMKECLERIEGVVVGWGDEVSESDLRLVLKDLERFKIYLGEVALFLLGKVGEGFGPMEGLPPFGE